MPTKPRARSLWLVAAGLPLVFVSGCPQLASDDFTKSNLDAGGSGGSSVEGSGGAGGTTPTIDLTTVTSSGGSEMAASTSQGGTDPGSGGSEASADVDTGATSTTSDTTTESTTSDTTTESTTGGGTTGGDTCIEEPEICDGLDNDCDGEPDQGEVCGGDAGCAGFAIGDRGYMFCGRPLGTMEARSRCSDQGMGLVQIDSDEENEELVLEADARWNSDGGTGGNSDGGSWGGTRTGGSGEAQQPAFWTGGSDKGSEGHWTWEGSGDAFWEGDGDGEPVGDAYANWGAGRPNEANDTPENCAAVYFREGEDGEIGTWNDLECGDGYPFICESP